MRSDLERLRQAAQIDTALQDKRIEGARQRKATLAKSRDDLRLAVGYLVLKLGISITEAANKLGIGRALATRLLEELEAPDYSFKDASGEIHFRLREPDLPSLIRIVLKERYEIEHVQIVPTSADDRPIDSPRYRAEIRRQLGWAAADLANSILERHPTAHVALSGGRTLSHFARTFRPWSGSTPTLQPAMLVSPWRGITYVTPSACLQFAFANNEDRAESKLTVLCPEVPPSVIADLKEGQWERYPEIAATLGPDAPRPDIVLTTVGRRRYVRSDGSQTPHPYTASIVRRSAESDYYLQIRSRIQAEPDLLTKELDDEDYFRVNHQLFAAGVVGDVFHYMLDRNGEYAGPLPDTGFARWPIEETTFAPTLKTLRKWKESGSIICAISGGRASVHAIRSALRSRIFNALVIDLAVGVQLLDFNERPGPFGEILDVPDPVEIDVPPD